MRKIPCLFERDFTDKRRPVLLQTVTPGCEWVLAGEGIATRKYDGTACLVHGGKLYKRYDLKKRKDGTRAPAPEGAIPCDPEPDPVTGHWPHWVEVGSEPESKWHIEAWTGLRASDGSRFRDAPELPDGTYELCGPRLQTNPHGLGESEFVRHGADVVDPPRTWDGLRTFLETFTHEGIVFHHPDGRMCKIRRDDYGFPWPVGGAG